MLWDAQHKSFDFFPEAVEGLFFPTISFTEFQVDPCLPSEGHGPKSPATAKNPGEGGMANYFNDPTLTFVR